MAVFIRNRRTGLFYGGYNHWVLESAEAFDFEKPRRAASWIDTVHLDEAEVVKSNGDRLSKISPTDPPPISIPLETRPRPGAA